MWLSRLVISLILFVGLTGQAFAVGKVVISDNNWQQLAIAPSMNLLKDVDSSYQLDEVARDIGRLEQIGSEFFNIGFIKGDVWLATEIHNQSDLAQSLMLEMQRLQTGLLGFYLLEDGLVVQQLKLPEQAEQIRHVNPVFQFDIAAQQQLTLVIQLRQVYGSTKPILWQQSAFLQQATMQLPLMGAFIGILAALAIYNLVIFFGIRQPAYFWYSAYIGVMIVWRSMYGGFGSFYIGYEYYAALLKYIPMMILLDFLLAGLFCLNFIELKKYGPHLYKWFKAVLVFNFITVLAAIVIPTHIATMLLNMVTVLAGGTYLYVSIYCWRRGQKWARFYVASWVPIVLAAIYTQAAFWDVLPINMMQLHLVDMAILLEALLLSLALADRLKINEDEKHYMSTHDPLTKLPNRNLIYKKLNNYYPEQGYTLLQIELSRIDDIRNTLGLKAASDVLCILAERLQIWSKKNRKLYVFEEGRGYIQRIGQLDRGSLVLVLKGTGFELGDICDELRSVVSEPIRYHSLTLECDSHIGAVLFPMHGNTVEQLIQNSNIAADLASRKLVSFLLYSDEKNLYTERRLALMSDLKNALQNSMELSLELQPQIDLQSNSIIGAEALLRWHHKEHGPIAPGEFVPLAEEAGLVSELTLWVIEEALQINQLLNHEMSGHQLSVNISSKDIERKEFVGQLKRLLEKSALPTNQLLLEVTESAMMSDPGQAHLTLEQISELGVLTSIDDFGTGYSSLSYLSILPVNELKIDRSFTMNIFEKEQNFTIAQNILELSKSLGLKAVGEGIEDQRTFDTLKQLGCDTGQGYFIGRPMPVRDYLLWCEDWQKTH